MGAPYPAPRRPAPHRPGRLQRILAALSLRRADRAVEVGRAADRWAPGDMAECIVDGPWFNGFGHQVTVLERGHVSIVAYVLILPDIQGVVRPFLAFPRWPAMCFDARGFRKLTPRADAIEAADASFLDQLRSLPAAPSIAARLATRLERILP